MLFYEPVTGQIFCYNNEEVADIISFEGDDNDILQRIEELEGSYERVTFIPNEEGS